VQKNLGFARYSDGNLDDHLSHLTNFSLNKNSSVSPLEANNIQGNIGCKWSLKALYEFLQKENLDIQSLHLKISDILIKTMLSVQYTINQRMMYLKTPM
jgi:tubulin polyglutamylase TTLL5